VRGHYLVGHSSTKSPTWCTSPPKIQLLGQAPSFSPKPRGSCTRTRGYGVKFLIRFRIRSSMQNPEPPERTLPRRGWRYTHSRRIATGCRQGDGRQREPSLIIARPHGRSATEARRLPAREWPVIKLITAAPFLLSRKRMRGQGNAWEGLQSSLGLWRTYLRCPYPWDYLQPASSPIQNPPEPPGATASDDRSSEEINVSIGSLEP